MIKYKALFKPGLHFWKKLPWFEQRRGEVFSQTGVVSYEGQEVHCRRVVVQLEQPTRDGETQIALLTNLPETDATSVLVAQLYRKRWRVETLFQVATETFHCEIKTLGYPKAALFSWVRSKTVGKIKQAIATMERKKGALPP